MESLEEVCPSCGRTAELPVITPQDVKVLDLLAAGRNNPDIAKALGISVFAIKNRINRLIRKLQISTRHSHPRIHLAYLWSCPIFRIGCGYNSPTPVLAADVIERDRLRAEEDRIGPSPAD